MTPKKTTKTKPATTKRTAKKTSAKAKPVKKATKTSSKKKATGKVVRHRASKTAGANKATREVKAKKPTSTGRPVGRPRKNPLPIKSDTKLEVDGSDDKRVVLGGVSYELPTTKKAPKPIRRVDADELTDQEHTAMGATDRLIAHFDHEGKTDQGTSLEVLTDNGAVIMADKPSAPAPKKGKEPLRTKAAMDKGSVVMDALPSEDPEEIPASEGTSIEMKDGILTVVGPKPEPYDPIAPLTNGYKVAPPHMQ